MLKIIFAGMALLPFTAGAQDTYTFEKTIKEPQKTCPVGFVPGNFLVATTPYGLLGRVRQEGYCDVQTLGTYQRTYVAESRGPGRGGTTHFVRKNETLADFCPLAGFISQAAAKSVCEARDEQIQNQVNLQTLMDGLVAESGKMQAMQKAFQAEIKLLHTEIENLKCSGPSEKCRD